MIGGADAARRGEAILAGAALVAVLLVSFLSWRSPIGRALRSDSPIPGALILHAGDRAEEYALLYHPTLRSLELVYIPRNRTDLRGKRWKDSLPSPRVLIHWGWQGAIPTPKEVKEWIASGPRSPLYFIRALQRLRRLQEPSGPYEPLLLLEEYYRLSPSRVYLSWLPADSDVPDFLARLAAERGRRRGLPPQAEVLNASAQPGLALAATKLLRSRGLDVVAFGNAAAQDETYLIDRAVSPTAARRAAELLGCPDAEVVTRVDPKAAGDVSVVLGKDYLRCSLLRELHP